MHKQSGEKTMSGYFCAKRNPVTAAPEIFPVWYVLEVNAFVDEECNLHYVAFCPLLGRVVTIEDFAMIRETVND
jgi:hypothetical protein